jgi:hypothetical protein
MRIPVLCITLAVALASGPAAAQKQSWGFAKSGSAALLVYGVPDSHAVTLSFICEPKKKTIDVVTTVLPRNAKKDRTGIIKLSNGSATVEYAGTIGRDNEDSGLHFAAATTIDAELFDLLDKGTSVRVEALGASENVPLNGIKKPLTQMRQACR